jgi:peptidyl-prolyl cis-trans isomerase SurA
MQRLRLQVLRNLIDETLQIQEAKASNIEIRRWTSTRSYTRVAHAELQPEHHRDGCLPRRIGSSPGIAQAPDPGRTAWQRLLRRNVQPFVNVSDDEVNEMLERSSSQGHRGIPHRRNLPRRHSRSASAACSRTP